MSTTYSFYPDMTHDDKIRAIYDHVASIMDVLPTVNPYSIENLLTDLADLDSSVIQGAIQSEVWRGDAYVPTEG